MKRRPKGFGSVYKLSGSRRKPWAVRISQTKEGKSAYKYLGFYATSKEALNALDEYNKNPYDLDLSQLTIADLWKEFKKRKEYSITKGSMSDYTSSYKHLKAIHDSKVKDLKTYHLQQIIDNIPTKWQTKDKTKTLLHMLLDIAIEYDIINRNYASYVKIGEKTDSTMHKPFTELEIRRLWECAKTNEFAEIPIVLCYTGMRPMELLEIRKENVYLSENYMIGGKKTKAGKNRIIPIHSSIKPIIEKWYGSAKEFLVERNGRPINYHRLSYHWQKLMEKEGLNHLPHDCRHTFVTMANKSQMQQLLLKMIVGHASKDLTEGVYTHTEIGELVRAVNAL